MKQSSKLRLVVDNTKKKLEYQQRLISGLFVIMLGSLVLNIVLFIYMINTKS